MADDAVVRIVLQDTGRSGTAGTTAQPTQPTSVGASAGSRELDLLQYRMLFERIANATENSKYEMHKSTDVMSPRLIDAMDRVRVEVAKLSRNMDPATGGYSTLFKGAVVLAGLQMAEYIAKAITFDDITTAFSKGTELITKAIGLQTQATEAVALTAVEQLGPETATEAAGVIADPIGAITEALGPTGLAKIGIAAGIFAIIEMLKGEKEKEKSPLEKIVDATEATSKATEAQIHWSELTQNTLVDGNKITEKISGHTEAIASKVVGGESASFNIPGGTGGYDPNATLGRQVPPFNIPWIPPRAIPIEQPTAFPQAEEPSQAEGPPAPSGSQPRRTGFRDKQYLEELKRVGLVEPNVKSLSISEDLRQQYFEIMRARGETPMEGMAQGGMVESHPGQAKGTDTIPAWLSEGEVVVPKNMVDDGAIDHLRGQLPGFNEGGYVSYMQGGGGLDVDRTRGGGRTRGFLSGRVLDILQGLAQSTMTRGMWAADPSSDPSRTINFFGKSISSLGTALMAIEPVSGAVVKAIGTTVDSFGDLTRAIDGTVQRYGEYSPEIAQAQAIADIRQTMGDLKRAQEYGNQLAEYEDARSRLQQTIEDAKIRWLSTILPTVTKIADILAENQYTIDILSTNILHQLGVMQSIEKGLDWIRDRMGIKDPEEIIDPTEEILKNENLRRTQREGGYLPEV